ncbi:V-type ATPase subunit [Candidatus Bathyarchaeota archaeon]|nr:V-type ATPase subunit [Candidatus Bathyarchaeota archaeon]
MGIVTEYHTAVALIGALKSFMLTSAQYEVMLRIRSPARFLTMLRETTYGEVLPEPSPRFRVEDVEKRLLEHYYQVFGKVLRATPPSSKPVLEAMLRRHEVNCLKTLLRAVTYHVKSEEVLKEIVPVGRYDLDLCRKILGAKDLNEFIDSIEPDLKHSITPALKLFEEKGSLIPVEIAMDNYALIRMWDSLKALSTHDREVAEHLIGIEVDFVNVMSVLRARRLGIEVAMLPISVYRYVEQTLLDSMSRASSTVKAMELLKNTPYAIPAVKASKDPSRALFRLEVEFKRYLARESERVFLGDWFHIGTLIGFLNLKFYEVSDLIAMLNGKVDGLEVKEVRDILILYQTSQS